MTEAQRTVCRQRIRRDRKRVAAAVVRQQDMSQTGVSDVVTDRRARMVSRNGFSPFGATEAHAGAMRTVGLDVAGTLDDRVAHRGRRDRKRRGRGRRRRSGRCGTSGATRETCAHHRA